MQWLSNGAAIYKLENMPPLDEDTVLTVMGLADNEKKKWHTATKEAEKGILLDHVDDEEEITAEDAGITIIHNGHLMTPIYTMEGMLWIDAALLAPTEKKDMEYRSFFVRNLGGHRAIAVKEGLVLTAVIMELNTWDDSNLSDSLKNLLDRCRAEELRRMGMYVPENPTDYVIESTEGAEEYDTEE
ncbi:hypothetical protein [Anaerotignum sp.]|nr:hypothetical protein [Anaerotignum sp.]MBQ7758659.1 hypothetical protein [Anaerotignum sp.]